MGSTPDFPKKGKHKSFLLEKQIYFLILSNGERIKYNYEKKEKPFNNVKIAVKLLKKKLT